LVVCSEQGPVSSGAPTNPYCKTYPGNKWKLHPQTVPRDRGSWMALLFKCRKFSAQRMVAATFKKI
jgi:hypothetical protein